MLNYYTLKDITQLLVSTFTHVVPLRFLRAESPNHSEIWNITYIIEVKLPSVYFSESCADGVRGSILTTIPTVFRNSAA